MTRFDPAEIVRFWQEAGPDRWFKKDAALDAAITSRFAVAHEAAARGELSHWEDDPEGVYALLLLLDQFPRNMFRDSPRAYATDGAAVALAERAIAKGFDRTYDNPERRFFYLPFMHAEDLALQERCVDLTRASGDDESFKYAVIHRDIIRDFGRFPHRNAVLGRETTEAERAFLEAGGFAG